MIITDKDNQIIAETEKKLLAYCRQQGLFNVGDRVVVACSGGADSMALLLYLMRKQSEYGIEVLAAHVDHGIRGAASHADANFVTAFCRKNGIEAFVFNVENSDVTIPENPSENWARELRYSWFDEIASAEEAHIATAHTMSDQAETVLFRMARGTGLHGLGGIPVQRGIYVRPFLCLTREETEAYCAALGQSYVQDETNDVDEYARNRIRHDAIPALEYANPAAVRCIGRLCAQMQELDEWLSGEAAALLQAASTPRGYNVEILRDADGPVLTVALHSLVSAVRDAEEKYVSLLRFLVLHGEGALQLTPEVGYKISRGELLRIGSEGVELAPAPPQPAIPGIYHLPGGYTMQISIEKYEEFLKNAPIFKKDLNCCADYAKIHKNILLRTRQPGDDYRPLGRHVRKTLKKFYNELSIPQEQRALLPLLAKGSEVVWLWDCGFAEGYAPDTLTREVMVVRTEKVREG